VLLNTTAALATAYATNNAGPVHQRADPLRPDRARFLACCTRSPTSSGFCERSPNGRLGSNHPAQAGATRQRGVRQLHDGRPRPVALEMPLDVMALETEVALPAAAEAAGPTMPDRS